MVSRAALAVDPRSPTRLRPVERLLLGYLAFASSIGVTRLTAQPQIGWVLAAHALVVLLILLARRPEVGPVGAFLRDFYPLLLLGALYPALDILNRFGGIPVHDVLVRQWEVRLFGREISRLWWQEAPSAFWSTILHGAYFAYYPIVLAPVAAFLLRGRRAAAQRSVLWILATFLLCYLAFLLFPVAGPYYEYPRPAAWFTAPLTARLVYATLERGSAYGAAFPSSHVAATLVATAAAYRGASWMGHLLLLPAVLLCVGVVYCQMHYGVDAIAGAGLAGLVIALGIWWERRLPETRQGRTVGPTLTVSPSDPVTP